LALHPATTSGESHRQNQHAGSITTPIHGNDDPRTTEHNVKIGSRLR
jgi:hypothetical protein